MLGEIDTTQKPRRRAAPRGARAVPGREQAGQMEPDQAQDGLSPPTQWLIAVRDHRDRAAFARLFDHFAPRLTAMMLRSGMGRAMTDDLVQDVLLTAWQKAEQFDPSRAQAAAWIYRIARNRQIDVLRRERRPVPDALTAGEETEAADAVQVLALDQEACRLRDALGRLSEEQRTVIEQSFMGDLTHTEIRQRTGLPLGTIKSRIRLGLERLRHELKELR
ncbi:sigma-70 family RNA polymerase sigma factor [Acidimangrovimonas pyrenivorans]|uniref:RNA polymerase sigma factor n=1 Tax=Acidimangrovimonas pyrenivorans TaxID=2030798 RepID=A0ABV7AEP8_9RHOB